jgi:hypothetical protein
MAYLKSYLKEKFFMIFKFKIFCKKSLKFYSKTEIGIFFFYFSIIIDNLLELFFFFLRLYIIKKIK